MSSAALANLRKDAELRVLTDRRLSVAWILLPIVAIAAVIASTVLAYVSTYAILEAASSTAPPPTQPPALPYGAALGSVFLIPIAAELLYLYFFYLLIRRRNQHFSRQRRFFSDLSLVLKEAAAKSSVNIDMALGSMESTGRQSQLDESEKSAVLWVVLLLVPIVSLFAFLYILYFLTGDYYKHERREDSLLSDAQKSLTLLGVQFAFQRSNAVPHRSYALYLILSIVTFGIFTLYWEYTLIRDPNNHFANHAAYEDTLLQVVAPLVG